MNSYLRSRSIGVAGALIAVLSVLGLVLASGASAGNSKEYSVFGNSVPRVASDPDAGAVELGMKFFPLSQKQALGVRFFKSEQNTGTHVGTLWGAGGTALAKVTFTNETTSGWQVARFASPITLEANKPYVISYKASNGHYAADEGFFTKSFKRKGIAVPRSAGVYKYGSGFPTSTYKSTNYYVDVITSSAAKKSGSSTSSTSAPSPTTAPTNTTAKPTTPTLAPVPPTTTSVPVTSGPTVTPLPGTSVLNLPRVPWEGGPSYYGPFAIAKQWNDPNFFPVGVWFESVMDQGNINIDKAAGLNTYVQLTADSNLNLIKQNGMSVIGETIAGTSTETVGWNLGDEADMIYGAGSDGWSGKWGWNTCTPIQDNGGKCGYTFMQQMLGRFPAADGRLKYSNYGKGVMMWQTDAEASKFVNSYTSIVSNDMYFYTDPNLCNGEAKRFLNVPDDKCRRASSYGITMDKMRALDGMDNKRQPILAFVENGHPFTEDSAPTINSNQLQGAVMNSLIHEARGIIYFNHNFGGSCISQHVIRDCGKSTITPAITDMNSKIKNLAPVLNTQSYQWKFNESLDTMLKAVNGSYYVFAMPGRTGGEGTQTLTLPAGINAGKAEVMFENRSLNIAGGKFTDSFAAEYSYHIYKITP